MVPFSYMEDNVPDQKLAELRRREEEELAAILSQKYGATYIDLSLRIIPEATAREAEAAAFDIVGKKISLAMRSPANPKIAALKQWLSEQGYSTQDYMVSSQSLQVAWSRYKDLSFATETKEGVIDISETDLAKTMAEISSVPDIEKKINEVGEMKRAYRISRVVEVVMAGAFAVDASDVHIEPEQQSVRIRYRLDGVLSDVAHLDHDTHNLLLSRVKLLSGLKLNIHDHAQDGRFSVFLKDA
jgi:type II secretory ATPase GspE/PulE/Tfp pilus assembly ATPase PilB-like protein